MEKKDEKQQLQQMTGINIKRVKIEQSEMCTFHSPGSVFYDQTKDREPDGRSEDNKNGRLLINGMTVKTKKKKALAFLSEFLKPAVELDKQGKPCHYM